MKTQKPSMQKKCQTSTCSAPGSPARVSPLPESAVALKMQEARSFLTSRVSLKPNSLRFLSLKTFPACLAMTKDGHLQPSSARYQNWGMVWSGRCWTAGITESRSHAGGRTLSDILTENVPEKYYLSQKQAEKLLCGSLAERRGQKPMLPPEPPAPSPPVPGKAAGRPGCAL